MTDRRIAIVTGAGRRKGIGRATAVSLAAAGWSVIVAERSSAASSLTDEERALGWTGAASVAAEINAAGGTSWAFQCDVRSDDQVRALAEFASERGVLGTVVNNAGSAGEAATYLVHELPADEWHRTIDVNLNGIFRVVSALVPVFGDADGTDRSIVNVSSAASIRPRSHFGAYSASKAAVDALTRQLALELAPRGIRVNAVSPGPTSTDMIDGTIGRLAGRLQLDPATVRGDAKTRVPLGRSSQPEEQAAVIEFLTSRRASFITGQIIQVDGGVTIA